MQIQDNFKNPLKHVGGDSKDRIYEGHTYLDSLYINMQGVSYQNGQKIPFPYATPWPY